MRAENQDIRGQLTAAQERIQELEVELELVKGKLLEVADESEGVAIKGLKDRLAKAEEELEDLRANDRVHTATKAALHAQVAENWVLVNNACSTQLEMHPFRKLI